MFQNWMSIHEFVNSRQRELLEEAKRARAASALRKKELPSRARREGVVLCETCPLRTLPQ